MAHLNLCVLLIVSVFLSTTESSGCTKTLSLCKLTVGDDKSINFPQQSPKGEKGETGAKGGKGDIGSPGYEGPKGERGNKGDIGPPGESGLDGIKGDKGQKGSKGMKGDQGTSGTPGTNTKGEKGLPGIPGRMGLVGPPGINGSCPCNKGEKEERSPSIITNLQGVCKDTSETFATGQLYVEQDSGSELTLIPISCEVRSGLTTLTCLNQKAFFDKSPLRTYSFTDISKGFWLTNNDTTFEDIYGLSRSHIEWFKVRSNTAFQTIRYHCFNSVPFSRDNVEKSLLLLTWNDSTLGPVPTLTNPFYYFVPNETDGCSSTKNAWSSTDIKIYSTTHERVPVVDFFFRDTGNKEIQKFKIEPIQICFD